MRAEALALERSIWVLGGWIVAAAGSLVISITIARLLTPASVGVFYLAWSMAIFSSIVARFGMDSVAVRMLALSLSDTLSGRAKSTLWRTGAFTVGGATVIAGLLGGGVW